MIAIFVLVTAEFLPASLLPAMAADFGISEGVAGHVVTATAIMGMIVGPTTAILFPRIDRKTLLVGFLVLALAANVVTAIAPNYVFIVIARLALGAAVAGTWSMAIAVAAQLVPADKIGRAMMVVNLGVTGATVAAVPLGAVVSAAAGWRTVFIAVAAVTVIAIIVFLALVPRIPAVAGTGFRSLVAALRSRTMIVGLIGLALLVGAHFGTYTFIRSGADAAPGMTAGTVALLLVAYGIGGLLGNVLVGFIADRRLGIAMAGVPIIIGVSVIGFSFATGSVALMFIAAAVWGIGYGANPTMSQTWISRAEPNRAEAAGGLFVATFQFAIAAGSAAGGAVLDATSPHILFLTGGIVALIGGAILFSTRRAIQR